MKHFFFALVLTLVPVASSAKPSFSAQMFHSAEVCQEVLEQDNRNRKRGEYRKIGLASENGEGRCIVVTLNADAESEEAAIEEFKIQYLGGRAGWVIKDPRSDRPLMWLLARL